MGIELTTMDIMDTRGTIDWFWGELDSDDDETHPPQFNEPEFGVGMEGDTDEESES